MEDDVLKLKEVVSVTFDTTPFNLFSKRRADILSSSHSLEHERLR